MNVSVADSNSVCSFEGDQLSCNIRDECSSYVQKTDKVKDKYGSTDTIVDKEPLSCLDSQRRGPPHQLLLDPPLREGEKPKCRRVLISRARPAAFVLRNLRRALKRNKKGKGKGGNKRTRGQTENAGDVGGSPKKRHVGKAEEASGTGTGTHNVPPGEAGKQRVEHSSSDEDDEADLYYLTKNDKDFYFFNTGPDCEEQLDDEDPDWEP